MNQTKMHGSSLVYPSLFPSAALPAASPAGPNGGPGPPPHPQPRSPESPAAAEGLRCRQQPGDPVIPAERSNQSLFTEDRSILSEEGGMVYSIRPTLAFCSSPERAPSRGRDGQGSLLSLEGTNPACSGTALQQKMLEKRRVKRQVYMVRDSGSSGRIINSP